MTFRVLIYLFMYFPFGKSVIRSSLISGLHGRLGLDLGHFDEHGYAQPEYNPLSNRVRVQKVVDPT